MIISQQPALGALLLTLAALAVSDVHANDCIDVAFTHNSVLKTHFMRNRNQICRSAENLKINNENLKK